jgi:predicted nucleotidyltransferase
MQPYKSWDKKKPSVTKVIQKVESAVHAVAPGADIVLYGSRARGDADQFSDWDFLVLVDPPLTNKLTCEIRERLFDIELETDNIISSIIRTKHEWNSRNYAAIPFKQAVETEGIII